VLAGIAKLRIGGWGWVDGDVVRHHVAYSAARLGVLGESPSPLARPLVGVRWWWVPLGCATVLLELIAPLALFLRRFRSAWIAAAWTMHLGIALTMSVVFPYPLACVAFAPLLALDRPPALQSRTSGPTDPAR
jgi:hypothetical protein